MKSFIDAEGREWELEINISSARRIRERCATVETLKDVDFLDYGTVLASLMDVFYVADLLYVVCERQAKERDVNAETFGRALKGKVLFDAASALTAEYIDFFPDPTTREKMRLVVEKLNAANERIAEAISSTTSKTLDAYLDDAAMKSGEVFSNASASSAGASAPVAS